MNEKKSIISIYDKMAYQLLPNIGFTNATNFCSEICNTDSLGLRFNDKQKNYTSIFEENFINKKPEIIITGGSTAMGMASSSDKKTLSSLLSQSSNFHFYNLAVRAYNGFQELIITQSLISRFKNLKKIFIVSGINDLYFFFDPNFQKIFPGPQVYGSKFYKINKEHLNFFQRVRFYFENTKKIEINHKITLKEVLNRNLKLWSLFAKSQSVEVFYFLQPFYTWNLNNLNILAKEKMNYGSSEIMNKIDNSYNYFKDMLSDACRNNDIKFKDLNELSFKKNVFVDRVHLNDDGFEEIAEELKKYL